MAIDFLSVQVQISLFLFFRAVQFPLLQLAA